MSQTDESALLALSLEYADAVRTRDVDRWAATWAEDARWVLGEGRDVTGRDAIATMWSESMERYDTVVQVYSACAYDVAGDTATGRCVLQELNVVADGTRRYFAGHYDDTYRRTGDGWRFASRRLTKYYQGAPDLTGRFFT